MIASRLLAAAWFASVMVASPGFAQSEEGREIEGLKSERTALLSSVLGTALPIAAGTGLALSGGQNDDAASMLILSGYLFGPSLGHFYADRPGAGWAGVGLRVLPVVGLGGAVAASWNSSGDDGGAEALAVGSLAIGAAMVVWDITRAPRSARSRNEEARPERVSIGIAPIGRALAPGVRVAVSM